MRAEYSVTELCQAMNLSPSGYYKWRGSKPSQRAIENEALVQEMKMIHQDKHMKNYGSPRMTIELNQRGFPCSKNRVARLMKQASIQVSSSRQWKPKTTRQDSRVTPASNLLAEFSKITAPGQVWVSDITYVFTADKTCYLSVVMDLYTRRIVGWAFDTHMRSSLVLKSLRYAELRFMEAQGVLFHSDRGSQYSSKKLRKHLKLGGYQQSMSAQGYCYDNAACESFFVTLKKESFPERQTFSSPEEARREIFDYIETFYNSKRLHSSLGYQSPQDFHQSYLQSN